MLMELSFPVLCLHILLSLCLAVLLQISASQSCCRWRLTQSLGHLQQEKAPQPLVLAKWPCARREMHIIAGSSQASLLTWKTCPVVLRALQGPVGGNKEGLWYKEVCLSARVPSV